MEQTNWEEKRVDLGYMVLCSHCNEQLCGCPQRESDGSWMMQEELKSFISSLLKSEREAGYKAGKEIGETEVVGIGKDEAWCEWFRCNSCEDSMITGGSNFCPNCGLRIKRSLDRKIK